MKGMEVAQHPSAKVCLGRTLVFHMDEEKGITLQKTHTRNNVCLILFPLEKADKNLFVEKGERRGIELLGEYGKEELQKLNEKGGD